MKCDIVYAGSKAVFGLPEIKLGIVKLLKRKIK